MGKCQKNVSLGKRGKEDISMSRDCCFWGFVGEFAVFGKDQAFSWKMKFLQPPPSAYGWCIEADSLRPICRQPNRNSYRSTEVNVLSHRSTACTSHMWTCAHIVLFSSLGGVGGNVRVKFSYCILDVLSEWVAGEKRSHLGVVAAVQHYTPSYCVFIWLACRSQGTAFWLSKKAVQYYLILSCIKCTDCFMNHYLLLIRFLNKVWATIQPVKYFAVSKRRLICERGLDSFCNILSLKLISFEVLGFL